MPSERISTSTLLRRLFKTASREMGICTRIEWLGISGNDITNLIGIERFIGLRRLDIAGTGITDFALLADLPFLSVIQISPEMERYLYTLGRSDIQIVIDGG